MFRPGDEVLGYCRRHHLQFGTYAEYTSVPDAFLAHKPESLSWEEAAALPLCGLTAHQALETLGLRGGEKLLVAGGAGGVGHLAIQQAVGARRAGDRHRLARQPRLAARARCRPARLRRP